MHIDDARKAATLAEQRKEAFELLLDLRGERTDDQSRAYADTAFSVYFSGRSAVYARKIATDIGVDPGDLGKDIAGLIANAVERRLKVVENELENLGVRFNRITRKH
jgi:hypothetical protein